MCPPWGTSFIHPWICLVQKSVRDSLLPLSNHILPVVKCSLGMTVLGTQCTLRKPFSWLCSQRWLSLHLSPASCVSPLLSSVARPLTSPAFLISPLGFSLAPVQRSPKVWGVWNIIPTQRTGVYFPSPQAAPGFEIVMNVCWFLCSGMCTYTPCWWIIDLMCGEVEAWPRANEGKVLLKTRTLSKINLNGNLKPENQLLFKWIVLKIRVLVLENISQGCLCILSWNNCVLAEMF